MWTQIWLSELLNNKFCFIILPASLNSNLCFRKTVGGNAFHQSNTSHCIKVPKIIGELFFSSIFFPPK